MGQNENKWPGYEAPVADQAMWLVREHMAKGEPAPSAFTGRSWRDEKSPEFMAAYWDAWTELAEPEVEAR